MSSLLTVPDLAVLKGDLPLAPCSEECCADQLMPCLRGQIVAGVLVGPAWSMKRRAFADQPRTSRGFQDRAGVAVAWRSDLV
jgi:hypothetical protein